MTSNRQKIADELNELIKQSADLYSNLHDRTTNPKHNKYDFDLQYEGWYTLSRRIVAQLLPERESDFVDAYKFQANRKAILYDNYRIQDYLNNTTNASWVFSPVNRALSLFKTQIFILKSAQTHADSKIKDIQEVLIADLFDDELDKARALHKNKLLREAGVVSGVVLEAHLQKLASAHSIKITKKDPTIAELNDPLKAAGVYDVPTWRLIQRLGDIRNYCDHKKERDPTPDEVLELIDGTDKITKTLF